MTNYSGCSMAKTYPPPIVCRTKSRAVKKVGRVFVDPSGSTPVPSLARKIFVRAVKNGYSYRFTWLHFPKSKNEALNAFESFRQMFVLMVCHLK